MNLYHLKTFYYVAKHNSYTKAADILCITQPAVTRQIQELQSTYDLVLFKRIGKKIVLTDAGETLYSLAEKIYDLEKQVEESIRDYQHQRSGKINIVTAETFGGFYLPKILINFNHKYPDIFISVLTLNDYYVVENISKLNYDIGFLSKEMSNPKIIVKELFNEDIVMITAPGHPLAGMNKIEPKQLDNLPIIMPEMDSGTRNILNDFRKKHDINFNIVCEFSNNDSIKTLVQEGMGISLISRNVVKKEIKNGDLVVLNINDEGLKRKFYITYHKEKYITKIIAEFIAISYQWAEKYIKEESSEAESAKKSRTPKRSTAK